MIALVADRRLLLRQLGEVIARKGPSTPNRNAVNRERTERRKELRDALAHNAHQIVTAVLDLIPRPPEAD